MTLSSEFESLAGVFAAAVQNADALICVTDEHGVLEYANPSFCTTLGYELDDIKGSDIDLIYTENGVCETLNDIWSAIKVGDHWRGDLEFQNRDKKSIWCRTTVSPMVNDMGGITHCVWVQLDITEQVEIERKHRASEKRLASILDNIPAYVYSKNKQGQYTYANKMLSMLHAVHVDDIIGKTDFELFSQDAADVFTRNDDSVFEKSRTVRALEHIGADEYGIERSYLSVKCPLEDEHGEIIELLGMSVDISEQQRLEQALRTSEEKLNSILDNMKARVYIKDADYRYTYGNEELCRILKTDRINLIGKDDFELFPLETAIGFRATDEDVFKTAQKVARLETSVDPGTREERFYWSVKVPLMDAEGKVHSLLGISSDVTDEKRLEQALRRNERKLTTILDNIKAHVYIKDINYVYTYVNADMCSYLGMSPEDVIGKTDAEVFGVKAAKRFHMSDQQVFDYKENCTSIEKSKHFNTRETCYFLSVKVPLVNDLGNPYALLGISTDVSEQKRLEKELREMASTDVLTGVNNRRYFLEIFERELMRAQRYRHDLSLIMLDVDHFKSINDEYGHAVGDDALKAMTRICQETMRTTDFLGRLGGEEFAIILPETDNNGAWQIAQRIRQNTEDFVLNISDRETINMTASFGVTAMQMNDESAEEMLKRADVALYEAKAKGRNRVCEN